MKTTADLTGAPERLMYELGIMPDGGTRHITKGILLNPYVDESQSQQIGFSTRIQLTGFVDTGITLESYIRDRKPDGSSPPPPTCNEVPDRVGLRFLDNMENLLLIQRAQNTAWRLHAPVSGEHLSLQYDIVGKIMGVVSNIPDGFGGSGYTEGDILTVLEGVGGDGQIEVLDVGTVGGLNDSVKKIALTNAGTGGYTSGWKQTSGGTGADCQVQINGILHPENAKDLLVLKNDGTVGIGGSGTQAKLDVFGNMGVRSESWSEGAEAVIEMGYGGHNIKAVWGTGVQISACGAENALTVKEFGGNVGIGTTDPAYRLDITEGNARILGENAYDTNGHSACLYLGNGFAGMAAIHGSGLRLCVFGGGTGTLGAQTIDAVAIEEVSGNVGIGTTNQFGGGAKVIGIANATSVPTYAPSGRGVLYVENGALKYRGSSGHITVLAVA